VSTASRVAFPVPVTVIVPFVPVVSTGALSATPRSRFTAVAAATSKASNVDLVPEVVILTVLIFAPVRATSSLSSVPFAVTLSRVTFAEV
jgi:hypothetical protein